MNCKGSGRGLIVGYTLAYALMNWENLTENRSHDSWRPGSNQNQEYPDHKTEALSLETP
jgi:hypothetical protein